MILHKYIKAEYGIKAILDSELKVSLPTKLNDPFEFLPKDIGIWSKSKIKKFLKDKSRQNRIYEYQKAEGIVKSKHEFKKAMKNKDSLAVGLVPRFQLKDNWDNIKKMKTQLSEHIRLISFSSEKTKNEDEILMWSHYSNNHTGFRLHYDSDKIILPSFELRKITYSHERPLIDFTLENTSNKFINQIIQATITKSSCWKYEEEFRLLIDPQYCTTVKKGNDSFQFAKLPSIALNRVDIGLYCEPNFIEDLRILSKTNRFKDILFLKAVLNKDKYKIDYKIIN